MPSMGMVVDGPITLSLPSAVGTLRAVNVEHTTRICCVMINEFGVNELGPTKKNSSR